MWPLPNKFHNYVNKKKQITQNQHFFIRVDNYIPSEKNIHRNHVNNDKNEGELEKIPNFDES